MVTGFSVVLVEGYCEGYYEKMVVGWSSSESGFAGLEDYRICRIRETPCYRTGNELPYYKQEIRAIEKHQSIVGIWRSILQMMELGHPKQLWIILGYTQKITLNFF